MILTKCYIENFGKHSNFTYDFNDGLNAIVQDNGWGKSTLAVFIKAMFYGLPVTRKSNLDENDRKKYTPWQSGNFGGYIEFKIGAKAYRIERYFGKKEAEDTFTLIDLQTNKKSTDYDENIGLSIFGVDAEAYERSTFIPQKYIGGAVNESLSKKLTNVIHGTDYTDSYERALEIINNRKREIKNNQNRGVLPEIDEKIYLLSQEIQEIKKSTDSIVYLNNVLSEENNKIHDLEKECDKLKNSVKVVADNKENLGKVQVLNGLKENAEVINSRIEEINDVLNGKSVSRQDLDDISNKDVKLTTAKANLKSLAQNSFLDNKYNALNDYFATKVPEDSEIDYLLRKNEEVKRANVVLSSVNNEPRKKNNSLMAVLFLILTIFFSCGGGVLITQQLIVSIVCFAFAVIFGVLALVMFIKKKSGRYEDSNVVTTTEASPSEREIREFITKYEEITTSYEVHLYHIKAKLEEYKELTIQMEGIIEKIRIVKNEILDLENYINNFFMGFGFKDESIPNAEKINILRQILIENESLIRQLNDNKAKISALEETLKDVKEIQDEDISTIQLREKEMLRILDEHKANRQHIVAQISKHREKLSCLAEKEGQLLDLENKKKEYEQELKNIKLASEYLESAKDELSSKYLSPMKSSFDKYLNLMVDNDKNYTLDTDLNVSVLEYGKSRELEYLSKGYQSVIDLCVRFALIDSLFEIEKPFIILDDPFVNLDKEKLTNAIKLLNNVAKDYQIIYLACHDSRV